MNQLFIIGNLTADPETRTTQSGVSVCSFTVAVNRKKEGQQEADFFRVSAWRQLGDICRQYLSKGRKVAVVGEVRAGAYTNSQGKPVGTLEVTAREVEFLSPKGSDGAQPYAPPVPQAPAIPQAGGFVQVDDEELPF